jgi:O-antigen/teichoic acid export membrane protein
MVEKHGEHSHKTIIKAISVFGFTQVMKMLIAIVGSKFVAVFLGPVGIGTVALLNNTVALISSLTGFGINITGIREMALAHAENNAGKFSERFAVLQRLSLFIGLIGAIITILFSPLLSKWTFGTSEYYFWFIVLSMNYLFSSLSTSRIAILQGLRMIKAVAISNLLISLCITIVTIPIYYFIRFDGIVPVIVLSSAIGLLINRYYTRDIKILKVKLTIAETIIRAKPLMKMGLLLSINVIFGQICIYVTKLYFNGSGETAEILGFYEVSTVILLSYVGMIFNAMSMDFYPRLTSVQSDNAKIKELVNDQIEIGLLLITPAITLFYLLSPLLIEILYTKEFMGVLSILKAALFAVILKAITWPLGFILLAKGENKLYSKQEIAGDLLSLIVTIAGYHYWGLTGIGLSSVFNYSLYGIYVYRMLNKKFTFSIRKDTFSIIIVSSVIGVTNSLIVFVVDYPHAYFPIGIVLIVSLVYSFKELDKRIDMYSHFVTMGNRLRRL